MFPLKTIAFLMSFFGMSAVSLIVPILGVANYMLIYQIYPEHAWWHKPLESFGMRYSMTAAICLMLGMLINLPRLPSVRPLISLWDLCAFGMVFTVVLGEFTGLSPSADSALLTDKFVKMMIFVFCLTRVTTTKRNFTIVLWALVIGSLYIGYDAWTAPRGAFARGRLEVIGGPDFRHSSGLASHMAAMLPLIAAVFLATRSTWLRIIPLLSGALTVNTVVLCRTRSAFIGLLCGLTAALAIAPKKRRLRTYGAMVVAALAGFALTDDLFWDRMDTLRSRQALQEDRAAMGRVTIWRSARQIVAEHPFGVGIGNFPDTVGRLNPGLGPRAAHNTFVLCATELGVQGLALFTVLVATAVFQARYCYRHAHLTSDPVWTRYMGYGLLLAIVTSLGTQMFTERLYTEAFWWILALPGCLRRVVHREIATEPLLLQQGTTYGTYVDIDLPRLHPEGLTAPGLATGGAARGPLT